MSSRLPGARTRVVVVEDSRTIRGELVRILGGDPGIEVVGEAADGATAIELVRRLRPDVVTMDMMLAGMDGREATEQIMGFSPVPILIVSASTNRGELLRTYDALAAGAVDVLDKPSRLPDPAWEAAFRGRVRMVARVRVVSHPRARLPSPSSRPGAPVPARGPDRSYADAASGAAVVALGASTGGPGALARILAALPADLGCPVLVVLHIPELFAGSLAEWFGGMTTLPVALATDGMPLPAGGVVLAPPGRHLRLRGRRLLLDDGPERHGCRPSVDALFESVAEACGPRAVAALLTGMGRDGAEGLAAVRAAGGRTIAQDRETSVIWGMPGAAVEIGAAGEVLPLDRIAPRIAALAGPRQEARR